MRDVPVRHDPMSRPASRFQIVQRTRARRVPLALALGAGWLLSLVLVWRWASPMQPRNSPKSALQQEHGRARQLDQRHATLTCSDQISRDANPELQSSLTECADGQRHPHRPPDPRG